MTRYRAIFFKVDGLDEAVVGNSYGLSAESLADAESEALQLPVPPGANLIKILDAGRVARRLGIEL